MNPETNYTPPAELVAEAVQIFGRDMVATVVLCANTSDPDGALAFFEDMGLKEEAECLNMLYMQA